MAGEVERFLSHVDRNREDDCWYWFGAGKGNGYGNVRFGGKNTPAHRRSYELFLGPVSKGLDVCHTCDVRFCVNPKHLFLETRKGNMADAMSKNRVVGGGKKTRIIREAQAQEAAWKQEKKTWQAR